MRRLKYWNPREKIALLVWCAVGMSLLTAIVTKPHPAQSLDPSKLASHTETSLVAIPSPVEVSAVGRTWYAGKVAPI